MHTLRSVLDETPYISTNESPPWNIRGLEAAWRRHQTVPGQPASLGELIRRHDIADKGIDLVLANTYLMGEVAVKKEPLIRHFRPDLADKWDILNFLAFGIPEFLWPKFGTAGTPGTNKGQVSIRATEFGSTLAQMQVQRGRPLVAALCETWYGVEDTILESASKDSAAGPRTLLHGPQQDEDWRRAANLPGSGLSILGIGSTISTGPLGTYTDRGAPNADIDFFSSKGVMLVHVPTPYGLLDVFLTHLHSGGDMPVGDENVERLVGAIYAPSEAEKDMIRTAQRAELAGFVAAHSTPGSPAIIVGDFNSTYPSLQGFADAWDVTGLDPTTPTISGGPDLSTIAHCRAPDGSTSAAACTPLSVADEPSPTGASGSQIDHVLIRIPRPADAFVADVVTIERLPWRRQRLAYSPPIKFGTAELQYPYPAPGGNYFPADDMPYLSDHVGIRVRLRFSSRG